MFSQALSFILSTFLNLFVIAALLRFHMQWLHAPFRNPFAHFVVAITDFAVKPLRRLIPGLWGLDMPTLLLAWFVELVLILSMRGLEGYPFLIVPATVYFGFGLLAAVELFRFSLYILIAVVFVQALLSWVNPYNPLSPLLNSLGGPFLRVFQRFIPPIGNIDLSPLFLFVFCQLTLMLPVAWLEQLALSLT